MTDLLVRGGPIFTVDADDRVAEAMLVRNGRIRAVGDEASVLADAEPSREVIDLAGKAVVPGFIDAHTHWELTAQITRLWLNCTTSSRESMLDQIQSAAEQAGPGDWVVVQGTFWGELPLRDELDRIARSTPVIVRRTMHTLGANTAALTAAGLMSIGSVPQVGARLELGPDGTPTGYVEEGFDLFPIPDAAASDLTEALAASATAVFARHGVTTIHDMPATRQGISCYQDLAAEDRLPVRVRLHFILPPVHQSTVSLPELAATGLRSGFGGPFLTFGGVKLFVDGYERASGWSETMVGGRAREPLLPRTFEQLVLELRLALESRIQVMMHAWGDHAQQFALDAAEAALSGMPADLDHRMRIEHMGNHGYLPHLLTHAARLGVIPVAQASFLTGDEPRETEYPRYVFRSAHAAGLTTPYSSDCSGARTFLADPWIGMAAMVERRSSSGQVISPEEAVTFSQALRNCTMESARAGFEEGRKGSLEPGKVADFSIADQDPRDLVATSLAEVSTLATHAGDRFTYSDLPGVDVGPWA